MLGSGGGEMGGGNSLAAQQCACRSGPEKSSSVGCVVCVDVFPLSVSLLFLFPLFAVLSNCPYPNPPLSACFFPFSSTPWRGDGRPRGAFLAGRSQTRTVGKQDGCLQPEGKDVQAWYRVGQPAVEMAKGSEKTKSLKRTEGFVPLARAVASVIEAYQEKISFDALDLFPLLGEARRRHRIFLHLPLLTLSTH